MEQIILVAIPLVVVLIGGWVAYGSLRNQVETSAKEIAKLQKTLSQLVGNPGSDPVYIKRSECSERTKLIEEQIDHIKKKIDDQGRAIKSFENFARYFLTKREGLGLAEVEEILNGD